MQVKYFIPCVVVVFLCGIPSTFAQCTFPSKMQGSWLTAGRGNLTISDEFIFNFPISTLGLFTLGCEEIYNGNYIVKSTVTFRYTGLMFSVLVCFRFTEVVDSLYYFHMMSEKTSGDRVFFNLNDQPVTGDQVCTLTTQSPTFIPATYDIMLKNGNGEAGKIPCPLALQAFFAYSFDSGSGNECTGGSYMSGCTESELYFNYTLCPAEVAYSATGTFYCLANITTGSLTYVTVHNNDVTVDGITTYRFTCLALESNDTDVIMTQRASLCGETQTSTYVDSGAHLHFLNSINLSKRHNFINTNRAYNAEDFLTRLSVCVEPPPTDWTWLYITLGCVGGVVSIIIIVIILYICFVYKYKQRPFRGGLEPKNMTPRTKSALNGLGVTFKPSGKVSDTGIPEDDTPINLMHLLRKDLISPPHGRASPSSSFAVTDPPWKTQVDAYRKRPSVIGTRDTKPKAKTTDKDLLNTPPTLFNIRETDSGVPSSVAETASQQKEYHVLGGVDHTDYGDLPLDNDSDRTPVMVLPIRSSGLAANEEQADDYDDDDDDDFVMETPGRSQLVAATQGMFGKDPMCPASRLPGIAEDSTAKRSYVGGGKTLDDSDLNMHEARGPAASGGGSNIIFLNEFGYPLPPRTPTPDGNVETIRGEDSILRVKLKRRASLPPIEREPKEKEKPKQRKNKKEDIDQEANSTVLDDRGQREPERGDVANNVDIVFNVPVKDPLHMGSGPLHSSPRDSKKGGKLPGAHLKGRSSKAKHIEHKRGELGHEHAKKGHKKPNKHSGAGKDATDGERDTKAAGQNPDLDEVPRPKSSLRMTRINIPELEPIPTKSRGPKVFEVFESPRKFGKISQKVSPGSEAGSEPVPPDTSRSEVYRPHSSRSEGHRQRLWLDAVQPMDNVWGKMSSNWKDGQS